MSGLQLVGLGFASGLLVLLLSAGGADAHLRFAPITAGSGTARVQPYRLTDIWYDTTAERGERVVIVSGEVTP